VEAVIDKDYSSGLIAHEAEADLFVILTNVPQVCLNFGTPDEIPLERITVDEAQAYYDAGHFPPGSMGPKILAAIEYIRSGGKEVIITSANYFKAALINRSGTKIVA